MYKPLIKPINSDRFIPTKYQYNTIHQMQLLYQTLVPTLIFVGIQTNSQIQFVDFQQSLKQSSFGRQLKNFYLGIQGKYLNNAGKQQKIVFYNQDELLEVVGQTNVYIEIVGDSNTQLLKILNGRIQGLKNEIFIIMKQNENEMIQRYSSNKVIDQKIIRDNIIQFVVPLFELNDYKNNDNCLIIEANIPIKFYIPKNNNSVNKLIDVFIKDLVSTLKVMIKNNVKYRKIRKQANILIDDFFNQQPLQQSKTQNVPINPNPVSKIPKTDKSVYILLSLLITFALIYLALKI